MRRLRPLLFVVLIVAGFFGVPYLIRHAQVTSPTTTTTTTLAPVVAPLTGLVDPGGLSVTRPALVIKIENTPDARPLYGVDRADMVYEEIVNGGITRLAAVFNSEAPDKIGPVRSVRPTDRSLIWPFGGLFAYSGGAPYAIAAVSAAPVKMITESTAGAAMFRDPNRQPPHNLYAIGPRLFAFGGTPVPPQKMLKYGQSTTGSPVAQFTVPFPSMYPVTWTWDHSTSSWDRSIFGAADITGTGVRLSPKNVVVMWINYLNGVGTFTSVGDLQGTGPAAIFEHGKKITGTWSRGDLGSPIVYRDAHGKVIAMTPGQSWIELLNSGATLNVQR